MKRARDAIVFLASFVAAARLAVLGQVANETAHEQIQPSIVVKVEPDRARGPAGEIDSGLLGRIGKCAVTVVAVQRGAATGGNKKIGKAVVVVVAHRDSHAERPSRHAAPSQLHR